MPDSVLLVLVVIGVIIAVLGWPMFLHLRLRKGRRSEVVSKLEDFNAGSYTLLSMERGVVGNMVIHHLKLRADSWYGVPTISVKVSGPLPENFEFVPGVRFTILDPKYEQTQRLVAPVRFIEQVRI
jgi:hypothetical protein